jgi:plastocyanin
VRRHLLPISLLAIVALAGCGGGDDDEPGRTATVPAGQAIEVVADEYSFDPETLVVEAGGSQAELQISLRNDGALAHNLKVFRDGSEVGGTPTFQGGETRSGDVTVAPGSYELVCTVGNHADLGMTGTLEVR